MPYIYSLAWRVTNEDYTIQRPLVMDWRTDLNTRDIGDKHMLAPRLFGESGSAARCYSQNFVFTRFSSVVRLLDGSVRKGGQEI